MSERRYRRVGLSAGAAFGAAAAVAPAAQAVDIPVTNTNDDNAGSLRAAIAQANSSPASDNIVFQSNVTGQITLTTGQIPITEPVSILGPGADVLTVSGNDASRIFSIDLATVGQAVTVSGLTLTAGLATGMPMGGGAIRNADAALTVRSSAVTESSNGGSVNGGGGISSVGSLTVENSTVSGNNGISEMSGGGYGGGISIYGTSANTIVNSTVSGNDGSTGGGVSNFGSGLLTITSSTIADNSANNTGGGVYDGVSGNNTTLQSTIVAENSGSNFATIGGFTAGFSLIDDESAPSATTGPNIINQDAQLDDLGNHGGPTETHLPAGSSPAIDKGTAGGLTVDQPGLARTQDFGSVGNAAGGDGTDIGAIERQLLEPGPGPIVGQNKNGRLCLGQRATIVGTKGKDKLRGTSGVDVISGKRGNDTIIGLDGNDFICGDAGKDRIKSGSGADSVRGGNGGDTIRGGADDDVLRGGSGGDSLFGEDGSDSLFGGSKAGGKSTGGSKPAAANLCDGGGGTDAATGCESTVDVP